MFMSLKEAFLQWKQTLNVAIAHFKDDDPHHYCNPVIVASASTVQSQSTKFNKVLICPVAMRQYE